MARSGIKRESLMFKLLTRLVIIFNSIFGKLFGVVLCDTMMNIGRKRSGYINNWYDFVRCSSLELVGQEIYENNISGAVAEVGVFRGEFAQFINLTFPDRKFYLFDTFEGFDKNDIKIEMERGYSSDLLSDNRDDDFTNTSVKFVLNKMKYPNNCIIKKGYFPQTAENLDEKFAFVSLDTDLFEPIYSGLKYFYPRMECGGYIFVHDFNNKHYSGAKAAVKKFAKEFQISYFPLTDIEGSAIILKSSHYPPPPHFNTKINKIYYTKKSERSKQINILLAV
jgi:O-methyltransferase